MIPDVERRGDAPEPAPESGAVGLVATVRAYRRLLLTLGVAVLAIGAVRAARQVVLPLWAVHIGLSPEVTSLVFGVAGAVDMALFYPSGKVMDRHGRLAVAVPSMLVLGAAMAVLPLTGGLVTLTVVAMVMSFGNGIGSGIVMTLGADVAPPDNRRRFLSMWRLMSDTGNALGPVVVSVVAGLWALAAGIVAVGGVGLLAAAAAGAVGAEVLAVRDAGDDAGPATRTCAMSQGGAMRPDKDRPETLGFATQAVHAGNSVDPGTRAIRTPLVMANSYALPEDPSQLSWSAHDVPLYTRNSGANQIALQRKLAALEHGADAVVLASGVAALHAVFFTLLRTGDHAVVSDVTYEAVWRLFADILPARYGVEATFVDTSDPDAVRAAVRPNTKLVHTEVIANPTTRVCDIPEIAAIAHDAGALLSVDSTFTPPPLYRPLDHGADLVVHSLTKFVNGHGDAMGGVVIGAQELLDPIRADAMIDVGRRHLARSTPGSSAAARSPCRCGCGSTSRRRSGSRSSWRPTPRSLTSPTPACPPIPSTRWPVASSTTGATAP